jgi:hypothetical protein
MARAREVIQPWRMIDGTTSEDVRYFIRAIRGLLNK